MSASEPKSLECEAVRRLGSEAQGAERIAAHEAACEPCRQWLEVLRSVEAAMAAARAVPEPDEATQVAAAERAWQRAAPGFEALWDAPTAAPAPLRLAAGADLELVHGHEDEVSRLSTTGAWSARVVALEAGTLTLRLLAADSRPLAGRAATLTTKGAALQELADTLGLVTFEAPGLALGQGARLAVDGMEGDLGL